MFLKPRRVAWTMMASATLSLATQTGWAADATPGTPGPSSQPASQSMQAPAVLYGTVRSQKDQKPLANVPILLQNQETKATVQKTSDGQGSFIFSDLPAGDYVIEVGGGNFSLQHKEGVLKPGTVGQLDFAVNPLSTGSSELVGRTYEGHGDHKIPVAAKLAVKNTKTGEIYSLNSDSQGAFDLKNIPSGDYLVQAIKRGYVPYSAQVAVNGKVQSDIRLHINRTAQANINANENKKIKDTTGAITVVDHKTFETWQTTGIGFALSNQPGINYYSRSGANGITGGMNYFTCRGYTTGGSNTSPSSTGNIEFYIEGVPLNNDSDGGQVYNVPIFNNDIASVDIKRGVTTAMELGNYASGCSVNIHLMQPTQDAYSQITSGMGSYGQYYTSFITNTGINDKLGVGAYNNLSLINQQGFQDYTMVQEYQDYANISKYLDKGKVSLMFTGAYYNYDRGASTSLQNFQQFGPSYNGLPNGENTLFPSGTYAPDSPYYKQWISQHYLVTLQGEDQLNSTVWVKNNAFALIVPYGVINVPVGIIGPPVPGAAGAAFQNVAPDYGGICNGGTAVQCANPFNFTFMQGQGFKVGDIAETAIQTFKGNKVHLGLRISYDSMSYQNLPIGTPDITGFGAYSSNLMTTIGGYLEDHYRPSDKWLASAGVRVMMISEQAGSEGQESAAQTALNNSVGGNPSLQDNAGQSFVVPLPHVGVNYYPSNNWKIYANAGQSFSAPGTYFFNLLPGQQAFPVKPEIVNDAEIGVRYSTDKGFVAFDIYNDYINNMFTATLATLPTGVTESLPSAAGLAEMRGFEAQFKRALPAGFSVDGGFTATDAYFVSNQVGLGTSTVLSMSGDPLEFVPNMIGNLDLNYAKGNWHITVNERYTGQMGVINTGGGITGTQNIVDYSPGYWTTNILLAYDLPKMAWYKKAQLFFNAFNLLNTNYYVPAALVNGYHNNPALLMVYPGEPINVFGGVTLTF